MLWQTTKVLQWLKELRLNPRKDLQKKHLHQNPLGRNNLLYLSLLIIILDLSISNLHIIVDGIDLKWRVYFIGQRFIFVIYFLYICHLHHRIFKWNYPLIIAIWLLWIIFSVIDLFEEIFNVNYVD